MSLDKLFSLKNSFDIEGSVNFESVQRNGDDYEKVDLKTILCSGSISYEILKNLKVLAGVKMFLWKVEMSLSLKETYLIKLMVLRIQDITQKKLFYYRFTTLLY